MNKKYSEYDWSDPGKMDEARNKFSELLNRYNKITPMEPTDFAKFISEYRAMVDHAPDYAGIKDTLRILNESNMDKAFQKYFKNVHEERLSRSLESLSTFNDEMFAKF